MGRKQDKLWIHAKRFGKKFKCNFCGKGFPATTSVVRFRYHLAGIPGQGVHVCNNVPEAIKQEAMDDVPEALKEEAMGKGLSHNKKQKSGSASPNSNCTLSEISDGNCSNEVDNLLAKFLEINDIDCNIVESTSFLNLVHAICKYGPGNYVPPSSDTLISKLIPLLRQEVEQSVATARQSLERTGFTVVPHVWCNEKEGKSFLSIIACSRKSAVLLNTFELPREKSFLEEFFRSVILDIGAENIVQCIVDVNVWAQLFGEFLTEECPHVCVTKCASLDIQSLFDSICMEVEWIQAKFDAAQVIFDYACKYSDILELMMRKYSNGCKELKQLCGGYGVLDAIIEAKDELVKLVESPEWVADVYGRGENGHYLTQIIKNEEFWDQGKKLQMALKPLHHILYLDDIGDLGYDDLYSSMRRAEEAIGRLCTDNPDEYQKLWDIFESKRGQIIDGIHKAAAFLNPQIMRGEIFQKSREMDEDIDYMLKRLVAADDKRAFVKQTLDYREILSNPSDCYMTIAAEEFPPCKWWAEFSKKFPILAKYAIRVLSQPCSSLSLKSSLSAFLANQIEQRRSVLVPELNKLNLRMNAFFIEKFNTENASKRDKVDLEEYKLKKPRYIIDGGSTSRRPLIRSPTLSVPQHWKLRFMTTISPTIDVGQRVESEQGSQIHVFLEDPTSGGGLQVGLPSTLLLTVSVLDGDFMDQVSTDDYWTREQFDKNDLMLKRKEPLMTGDFQVMLKHGKGVVGELIFNYSSILMTRSGQFRLGVKTALGYSSQGIRILEGISSAFIVVDNKVTRTPPLATWDMALPDTLCFEGFNELIQQRQHEVGYDNDDSAEYAALGSIWNFQLPLCSKPKHAAAKRVKKKAILHLHKRLRRMKFVEQSDTENKAGHEFTEPTTVITEPGSQVDINQVEDDVMSQDDAPAECNDTVKSITTNAGETIDPKPDTLILLPPVNRDDAKSMGEMNEEELVENYEPMKKSMGESSLRVTGHDIINPTDDDKNHVKLFGVRLTNESTQETKGDMMITGQAGMSKEITSKEFGRHWVPAVSRKRKKGPILEQINSTISFESNGDKRCNVVGCSKAAEAASGFCTSHRSRSRCQKEGCQKRAEGRTAYCKSHGGGKRCSYLGCTKSAEGKTDYCIAHGGGCRCEYEGCSRASRGRSGLCKRHGGGKRCNFLGCIKSAEGKTDYCITHGVGRPCEYEGCFRACWGSSGLCKRHGGGKRCNFLGCIKSANGKTDFCKAHGEVRRCKYQGCSRASRGRTDFCIRHGGGKRCIYLGCGKSAVGRTDSCKAHGGV